MKEIYDLLTNEEYVSKKYEFIEDVIGELNPFELNTSEYIIIEASETLRKSKMKSVLNSMIDTYYFHHQYVELEDLFNDPFLVRSVYEFRIEFLNGFLQCLARRDRDIEIFERYNDSYITYEDLIKEVINGSTLLMEELECEKVLTVKC